MTPQNQFEDNLERWALFSHREAELLRSYSFNRLEILKTSPSKNDSPPFHQSKEEALQEAKAWFARLDLRKATVLFVYGVGSGDYYEAAKEWLKDSGHYLVFLEDDLEVLYRLFETEQGEAILYDKQVRLRLFGHFNVMEEIWASLAETFVLREYIVTALQSYEIERKEILDQIKAALSFWFSTHRMMHAEIARYGQHFFTNLYQNLLLLPDAYRANGLFGKFPGIPAIICGAGPSLSKNLELLEKLKDRALIFAGGSAMNAVNSKGFNPHFGAGIDPNAAQVTRLIMNTAYEVPFFYRSRLNYNALSLVQGPHLYVTGSGGYRISNWLEKSLGIAGQDIDEGLNVINFTLSLACALGCNPIIFVGLDLAYSEGLSYYEGVVSHPTHDRRRDFLTKTTGDELLLKADIYGNPVNTHWKWISESLWFTKFVRDHPDLLFINATEGGIGIPGVPNKPLHEVVEHLLLRRFDLDSRVHGEIQNSQMPDSLVLDRINELIEVISTSLDRSEKYCDRLQILSEQLSIAIEQGGTIPDDLMTQEMNECFHALSQEVAYQHILSDFEENYKPIASLSHQQIAFDFFIASHESAIRKVLLQAEKFKFLKNAAAMNKALISLYIKQLHIKSPIASSQATEKNSCSEENYSFDKGAISIIDPELNLELKTPMSSEVLPNILYYKDSIKKFEEFFLRGVLHGPVRFYKEDGSILAQSWYVNGIKQGKSIFYYHSGALYSIRRFKDDALEGRQQYYYPDGKLRTLMHYTAGTLDGEVLLFYSTGQKKREINFSQGKWHGFERIWNEAGLLILEVEYNQGRPINKARTWHHNGQLSLEIEYDSQAHSLSVQQWSSDGKRVEESLDMHDDYYDTVAKQTQVLTRSLENVFNGLSKIAPVLFPESNEIQKDLQAQLHSLKDQIIHLEEMHNEMLEKTLLRPETVKEPIWKTPSTQSSLKKLLEENTKQLRKEIEDIQHIVLEASKELKKKILKEKPSNEE